MYGEAAPPDPALLYVLPNQARYQPDLFVFQRAYEGTWSVDVFYDSGSASSKLDGMYSASLHLCAMMTDAYARFI